MSDRPNIAVFCGSSHGTQPLYRESARRLGTALAREGLGVVYGGGGVGLMGVVADAALAAGGRVTGVIPEPLATKELTHTGLTELHVVAGMHERKALMASLSAGFATLPGGIGTFEEFFEMLSWAALGLHQKPIGILNVDSYFDPLLAALEHGVKEGFIRTEHLAIIRLFDRPESLAADLLASPPPPRGPRWIDAAQT
jgi:uncharacterized protein (TIGR00730 family)